MSAAEPPERYTDIYDIVSCGLRRWRTLRRDAIYAADSRDGHAARTNSHTQPKAGLPAEHEFIPDSRSLEEIPRTHGTWDKRHIVLNELVMIFYFYLHFVYVTSPKRDL